MLKVKRFDFPAQLLKVLHARCLQHTAKPKLFARLANTRSRHRTLPRHRQDQATTVHARLPTNTPRHPTHRNTCRSRPVTSVCFSRRRGSADYCTEQAKLAAQAPLTLLSARRGPPPRAFFERRLSPRSCLAKGRLAGEHAASSLPWLDAAVELVVVVAQDARALDAGCEQLVRLRVLRGGRGERAGGGVVRWRWRREARQGGGRGMRRGRNVLLTMRTNFCPLNWE